MHVSTTISRVIDLLDPRANVLLNMSLEEALERVASGEPERVREIDGQFALLQQQGVTIRMARSIGRPMRYFLAKQSDGPCLVVAERIDEIHAFLRRERLDAQFHPSYTRMVPAHHVLELALIGCPDPNPVLQRFFTPSRNRWDADLDEIGRHYIGKLAEEINRWLDRIPKCEPIGVLFSGGIDSGAVFLVLYHLLLSRGESPARLKAFTLTVEGEGPDEAQARRFLDGLRLTLFLESIEVRRDELDYHEAVRVIEDYKPLDVQAATMGLALCRGIRARYPQWRFLVDGDGGDENLKDYSIEEDPELTIRSVLNNALLYHEGWGVNAVKHSLTYSGGQSRGHVRTFAPARLMGFDGFSPFALPNVIEIAEGIPFVELAGWEHERLYALKGEIVRRGVQAVTDMSMPVFPKRRFQHGAAGDGCFADVFPADKAAYRKAFAALYE
jgi:asparagine synthase (glutamine-hydrolysing)